MAIKLDDLASWKLVPKGESLLLPGDTDDLRKVRIHLNCEDQTWCYVSALDVEQVDAQFIAAVGPGLETVEFYARGEMAVTFVPAVPDDKSSQTWLYTSEIDPNVSSVPDAVSFTEIHQRRARNPELEIMQLIARQNERRMDERLARMEALISEQKEVVNVDAGTTDEPAGSAGDGQDGGAGEASGEKPAGSIEPSGGSGADAAG